MVKYLSMFFIFCWQIAKKWCRVIWHIMREFTTNNSQYVEVLPDRKNVPGKSADPDFCWVAINQNRNYDKEEKADLQKVMVLNADERFKALMEMVLLCDYDYDEGYLIRTKTAPYLLRFQGKDMLKLLNGLSDEQKFNLLMAPVKCKGRYETQTGNIYTDNAYDLQGVLDSLPKSMQDAVIRRKQAIVRPTSFLEHMFKVFTR